MDASHIIKSRLKKKAGSFSDYLFGRPLANYEDRSEKVGPAGGIPIFGLDALGSTAYGPEAALTILLPLGLAGVHYLVPITILIVVLIGIVFFSYRQTIDAYPKGGGSYTVAKENLGISVGLFAGTALMIDYILVVAVGISAGIGALISAVPAWQNLTLPLCLLTLLVITFVNIRGVRDTGAVFFFPTYLFIGCLLAVVIIGAFKIIFNHTHPIPISNIPEPGKYREMVSYWLLLKAFSSGCTAMTGIEAVSNGVTAFREPRTKTAQKTLGIIIGLLILMLLGIAFICKAYGIGATRPGESGYESILSQVTRAVAGKGWFYYITSVSILLALAFQANTAFTGFPILCKTIAQDGYLPHAFVNRGRRLVYTHGTYVLAVLAGLLICIFEGVTDKLIPLFAIGAFLAFTFSQAGMVAHWMKREGTRARYSMIINGLGAIATGVTTLIIIVAKFSQGAWITLLLIPGILFFMRNVRKHYIRVNRELAVTTKMLDEELKPPIIVVPAENWNKNTLNALHSALMLSKDVTVLHINSEEKESELQKEWRTEVETSIKKMKLTVPKFVVIQSPYRFVITPILDFVLDLEKEHPDRQIAVLVPHLVEHRWYQRFLHNQRAELLSSQMLLKGNRRIIVINVPWYLKK